MMSLTKIDLFAPLPLRHGPELKNRFMLAPLTNLQSHPDGRLSDEEIHWLTMRAEGGFGLTMTAASHVHPLGHGFPGQFGTFSDDFLPGLSKLAKSLKAHDTHAVVQLVHGGMRSPKAYIGQDPVCPSDNAEFGARALTEAEVQEVIESFISSALRCEKAGFDGVEIHGAHGYLLCQFLSPEVNQRKDRYGGSLPNRYRIIGEIIAGIRKRCGPKFSIGLRLSPERFGLKLAEIRDVAQEAMLSGEIDYLDMSLWSAFKTPEEVGFAQRPLIEWFAELKRGSTPLGVAGKIMSAQTARDCLSAGVDFVLIGRGAILHHDYPKKVKADPDFQPVSLPVTRAYLESEGLSAPFVNYMATWAGFVAD